MIELTTYALQVRCSTTEIGRRGEGVIMTRKVRCWRTCKDQYLIRGIFAKCALGY